jgi:hypothetical protein
MFSEMMHICAQQGGSSSMTGLLIKDEALLSDPPSEYGIIFVTHQFGPTIINKNAAS